MTGFAREEGHDGTQGWFWELRSVNSRGLDIRCKLPPGHEELEIAARELLAARFDRGSISVSVSLSRADSTPKLRINRELLDDLLALHKELAGRVDAAAPKLENLLAARGVVEMVEEEETPEAREARLGVMRTSLETAVGALAAMRAEEGARLTPVLRGHLDEITRLSTEAAKSAVLQPKAIKARFREQVSALLDAEPALPEERLAQEAALLAAKSDVREELDRLTAHIAAARDLLEGNAALGRRLDFLCQEMNREANTFCAKSPDVALTTIGLDIKAAIEQLREQVQNIE